MRVEPLVAIVTSYHLSCFWLIANTVQLCTWHYNLNSFHSIQKLVTIRNYLSSDLLAICANWRIVLRLDRLIWNTCGQRLLICWWWRFSVVCLFRISFLLILTFISFGFLLFTVEKKGVSRSHFNLMSRYWSLRPYKYLVWRAICRRHALLLSNI